MGVAWRYSSLDSKQCSTPYVLRATVLKSLHVCVSVPGAGWRDVDERVHRCVPGGGACWTTDHALKTLSARDTSHYASLPFCADCAQWEMLGTPPDDQPRNNSSTDYRLPTAIIYDSSRHNKMRPSIHGGLPQANENTPISGNKKGDAPYIKNKTKSALRTGLFFTTYDKVCGHLHLPHLCLARDPRLPGIAPNETDLLVAPLQQATTHVGKIKITCRRGHPWKCTVILHGSTEQDLASAPSAAALPAPASDPLSPPPPPAGSPPAIRSNKTPVGMCLRPATLSGRRHGTSTRKNYINSGHVRGKTVSTVNRRRRRKNIGAAVLPSLCSKEASQGATAVGVASKSALGACLRCVGVLTLCTCFVTCSITPL